MERGDSAGGSQALADQLREHGDEIEADLQRYYGVDLREVFREPPDGVLPLTPRRVLALLAALPEGTAFTAALAGGKAHRGWTYDRYLAKAQLEAQRHQTYAMRRINGDKSARLPQSIKTPADEKEKRRKGRNMFEAMATQRLHALREQAQGD